LAATIPITPDTRTPCGLKLGESVRVVGQTSREELGEFFAQASVHAVPSLFETTGLVSLEAALSGCNVVTTEVGYAREYFEDMAWYCAPYDLGSIRSAVLAAINAPPQDELRRRVLDRHTWAHTGAATAAAYRDLGNHSLDDNDRLAS
jgi:glycosyltransferase involved in cell wall biosynthesis